MKSISSAIVIAAGIYGLTTFIPLMSLRLSAMPFLGLAVCVVIVYLGLVGWWASLKYDR